MFGKDLKIIRKVEKPSFNKIVRICSSGNGIALGLRSDFTATIDVDMLFPYGGYTPVNGFREDSKSRIPSRDEVEEVLGLMGYGGVGRNFTCPGGSIICFSSWSYSSRDRVFEVYIPILKCGSEVYGSSIDLVSSGLLNACDIYEIEV